MESKIQELKDIIANSEESLSDVVIKSDAELVALLQEDLDNAKRELAELEAKSQKAVKEAEVKVEKAEKKGDDKAEKKAKAELKEAKSDEKELEKVADKLEKVEEKTDKAEKKVESAIKKMEIKGAWGGKRPQAGRKGAKAKASAATKIVKPKGVAVPAIVKVAKVSKPVPAKKEKAKMKSVRAFGQTVEYKNDADFCSQLIKAFKKRKSASKKGGVRRKTKPVFGVITSSVKGAVSKALHSVSEKKIQANPKEFLAKAQRLEKSAMRFLEDFISILGSDFKKSEITSEFGELEKAIKKFVERINKSK